MLRAIRENTKWIFYILAVAFVGWLVFDVGMGVTGRAQYGGADVVLKVNGEAVHLPQYQAAVQAASEQYRRQAGANLTREDEQQVQNQVVDQLIQEILLREEYRRLGISVTDQELIAAARSSPPPEVVQVPEFQTNGQFDISKWQRFLATGADRPFLEQLEARYRQQIPQAKLYQYLIADVYVSDPKLWRIYRDEHDSVKVALLAFRPDQVPDSDASVSDADLERFYTAHRDGFTRPAIASLSFVAQPRWPDAADSAAALARATRLRVEIARGGPAQFAAVAKRESADSVSGAKGGDLGWFKPKTSGFDQRFLAALLLLRPGELSQPVLSRFGYHLLRVEVATGDSVRARHILIPIALQGKHQDYVEARADTLERLAAEQADGSALDSAARKLTLPLAHAPRLVENDRLTLGRYVIPNVSVWAFEARVGETSPVIEGEPAYYVFRLDSLTPGGVPPLAQIHDRVLERARVERKRDLIRQRAEAAAQQLQGTPHLRAAGRSRGVPVLEVGPFTRLAPPGYLQREPLVVGAAFGLRPGERSGLITGESGYFVLEGLSRTLADSAAWLAQRDQQRESLLQRAQQARVAAYLAALRAAAQVVDRRKQLFRPQPASGS